MFFFSATLPLYDLLSASLLSLGNTQVNLVLLRLIVNLTFSEFAVARHSEQVPSALALIANLTFSEFAVARHSEQAPSALALIANFYFHWLFFL